MHYVYGNGHPRDIIKRLRAERGFSSDRSLAIAAGVNQPNLSRYLSGKSDTMEIDNLCALARALDVTLSELLGEVPISSGASARELVKIMEELPDPERDALLAAGRAMALATRRR